MSKVRKRLPPRVFLLLGVVFLLFSCVFWYMTWEEARLRFYGITATASVVDCREILGRRPSLQVRYHFQIQGDETRYAVSDPFWGRDYYAPINREGWEHAQKSREVSVIYDGQNPWNNRPVQSPNWLGDLWFWVVGGTLTLLLATVYFVLGRGSETYRTRLTAPTCPRANS